MCSSRARDLYLCLAQLHPPPTLHPSAICDAHERFFGVFLGIPDKDCNRGKRLSNRQRKAYLPSPGQGLR
ncbi:hypothetical protein K523DRAFT_124685 [Schizophyllum commune Tattone D]|nr:hypothetical protein K523DRAFT_124685 [Schizophyllum commune Tattone D]